jgi:hypothetical protein
LLKKFGDYLPGLKKSLLNRSLKPNKGEDLMP